MRRQDSTWDHRPPPGTWLLALSNALGGALVALLIPTAFGVASSRHTAAEFPLLLLLTALPLACLAASRAWGRRYSVSAPRQPSGLALGAFTVLVWAGAWVAAPTLAVALILPCAYLVATLGDRAQLPWGQGFPSWLERANTTGYALGGLGAALLAVTVGAESLLLASAGLLTLCLGISAARASSGAATPTAGGAQHERRAPEPERSSSDAAAPISSALAVLLLMGGTLSMLAFLDLAARQGTPQDLAMWLGLLIGVGALVALCLQSTLGRHLSTRYGQAAAMLLLPAAYTIGAARRSPVEWLQPTGLGLAALLTVGIVADGTPLLPTALALLAVVGVAWVALSQRAIALHRQALAGRFERRLSPQSGLALALADQHTLLVLREQLKRPYPREVTHALALMEQGQLPTLARTLVACLAHPDPEVRLYVLDRVEGLNLTGAAPELKALIEREEVAAVRGRAWGVLAALDHYAEDEEYVVYLQGADEQARGQILAGMLKNRSEPQTAIAATWLERDAADADPRKRQAVAEIMASARASTFGPLLNQLLTDPVVEVRRAALLAAGHSRGGELWPLVVAQLNDPRLVGAAFTALLGAEPSVLDALDHGLSDPQTPRHAQLRLVRVCSRRGDALSLLRRHRDHTDRVVRQQVLRALMQADYRADNAPAVRQQIEADLASIARLLAAHQDLLKLSQAPMFARLIGEATALLRERIFLRLASLDAGDMIAASWRILSQPAALRRTDVKTLLAQALDRELRGLVMPLAEDLSLEELLRQLAIRFPQPLLPVEARLRQILSEVDEQAWPTLQATAAYTAGQLRLTVLAESVAPLVWAHDEPTREAALWALERLSADGQGAIGSGSVSPEFGRRAQEKGGTAMLLMIERLLALKNIAMFASAPDYILAQVAALLREVELGAGEQMFEQGDEATAMYIVYRGTIRISRDGRPIEDLGENSIFGEMALFDHEPRLARATALRPTLLLRLDQDVFGELIADYPDVLQGVVGVLLKRLRARTADVALALVQPGGAAVQEIESTP